VIGGWGIFSVAAGTLQNEANLERAVFRRGPPLAEHRDAATRKNEPIFAGRGILSGPGVFTKQSQSRPRKDSVAEPPQAEHRDGNGAATRKNEPIFAGEGHSSRPRRFYKTKPIPDAGGFRGGATSG
jgi:hypothetical protein